MALDYKYVIQPVGLAENHIIREMFEDVKNYINDSSNFDFANKALSNLASVAINTSLVSDTDNTDDLGTSSVAWKDLFLSGSIKKGANTVITLGAAGEVTQPLQPSFYATNGSTGQADVTGDNTTVTVAFGTEVIDRGGDFASNTFTAPVTGLYFLSASVRLQLITTSHTNRTLTISTSNRSCSIVLIRTLADTILTRTIAVIVDMDANDTATVTVNVEGSTKTVDIFGGGDNTFFSGSLIN